MTVFLLSYNRTSGELEVDSDFATSREAMAARMLAESAATDPDVEFTVLEADSVNDLLATHSRYFETSPQMAARLIVQAMENARSAPNADGYGERRERES